MPVPLTRSVLIAPLAAAGILLSAPAFAFCSKPITPHCVEDDNLAEGYVSEERCRRALEDHVEDLTRYRDCLTAEVGEIDEAVERFRSLLSEGPEKSRSRPAGVQTTAGAAS
jgi:hypothetical protein